MCFKSDENIIMVTKYILKSNDTVREAGKFFGVSKSSIFKYITIDLPYINNTLAEEIRKVLDKHIAERHIRGGKSTQKRWEIYKKNYCV